MKRTLNDDLQPPGHHFIPEGRGVLSTNSSVSGSYVAVVSKFCKLVPMYKDLHINNKVLDNNNLFCNQVLNLISYNYNVYDMTEEIR